GVSYYEFVLGVNQKGGDPLISLDELRIYTSNSSNTLHSYDPVTGKLDGLSAIYDMDGGLDPTDATWVKLTAAFTSGGGNGLDMYLDVPTADFAGTNQLGYIYLYTKMGVQNLNSG